MPYGIRYIHTLIHMKSNPDIQHKPRPKRVNRTLTCILTGKDVMVKPDKYEKLVARWDEEADVNTNFICFEVEKALRDGDMEFLVSNSLYIKNFKTRITTILTGYNERPRSQESLLRLQNELEAECQKLHSKNFSITTSEDRMSITGFLLKDVAFVNQISLTLDTYETQTNA